MKTTCALLMLALALAGCGNTTAPMLQALGTTCRSNSQCASNLCQAYAGGAMSFCTLTCTANMPAPQCTAPSDGTCNGMGFCKFPMTVDTGQAMDLSGVPTGTAALGASCTTGTDCASGVCAAYANGMRYTFACTANMPAPQCTAPADGTCNGMGFCRFPPGA